MSEELTQFERTGNPYPGLRPFETEEYNLFFGREGQSDELLARLGRTRFLAVVGTSGSGKSSLIRAGLKPALYGGLMAGTGSAWRIAVMRPGHDPLGNLARALAEDSVLGSPEVEDAVEASIIETTLRRSTLGLVDAARQARLPAGEHVLVVVDQFEELFRFRAVRARQGTDDEASAFVKLLLEAPRQRDVSLYVVLTMRSDFLGDCAQFQGLPEAINDGQYLIPRMTRDERRMAITGPAVVGDGEVSPPLVNRLLNDVGDNPDQLPILQHALMRTWEHWSARRRGGEPVGLEDYLAVGTMSDALSLHADEAFNELKDERSRHVAEVLFKALTERGADNREVRRPTRLREVCEITGASAAEVAAVVEVFRREGRSFLMPPEGTALEPETVIDISHESLIRNWERLREWVKEEAESARIYRRLADAAAAHRAGEGGLLDDVTLGWVNRWHDRHQPNRAWGVRYHPGYDEALAHLAESQAASDARVAAEGEREQRELAQARAFAEQQRIAARRLRWLLAGMAVMFLLSLGTAAYALRMSRVAEGREREATDAKVEAQKAAEAERATANRLAEEKRQKEEAAEGLRVEQKKTAHALEAEKAAVKEQQAATARAKDEAAKARTAERAALTAKTQAERATTAARLSAESLSTSTRRSVTHLLGISAFRHGNYKRALGTFAEAQTLFSMEEAVKTSSGQLIEKGERKSMDSALVYQKVTLDSDTGAALHRLGRYDAAIQMYQKALSHSQKIIPANILDLPDTYETDVLWVLFDLKHQLGQAHRDYAVNYGAAAAADGQGAEEAQRKIKEAYDKATENFREAARFQERLLRHEKEAAAHAGGFESLARLLSDLGEYKEAEKYFERVLEVRKEGGDYAAYVEALKEAAQFHVTQNNFARAESLYKEALDRLTNLGTDGEVVDIPEYSGGGLDKKIAELYGELGEVYARRQDEGKSALAFRLVSLYQSLGRTDRRLVENLLEIADTYEKLGEFRWAAATYRRALGVTGPYNDEGVLLLMKLAAVTYKHLNSWGGAEKLYRQALKSTELPRVSPDLRARLMRELGALYTVKSDSPGAARLSENWLSGALAYWEQKQNRREVYGALSDLAAFYRRRKETDKLLAAQRRRSEVAAEILAGSRHPRQLALDAQKALNEAGFSAGAADGTVGPRTKAALRNFQQAKGLTVSGQLDVATASALGLGVGSAGGAWDAGRYAEAFALYVTSVGDLTNDLLESGKKEEAAASARLLLDDTRLGVAQVVATDALDTYVALLEKYRDLLQPLHAGPYASDDRAELMALARERRSEVEQIAQRQDDYQQQTRQTTAPTVAPTPTPTPAPAP